MLTRTYRAFVVGSVMFTTLVGEVNVYVAEPTVVAKFVPSVLVWTDSVCVRVAHDASGGSVSVTLPMLYVEPRSTWSHCGKAPFTLSQ
jgi:hypothetical protein